MKVIRWLAVALMLACILLLVPSGMYVGEAEIIEIPLDAQMGVAPNLKYLISANEYKDPSIHVTYERGEIHDTDYVVARIKIANATQLRTTMEGSFHSSSTSRATTQAKEHKAVFAINGDYLNDAYKTGYVVRQGKEYRRIIKVHPDTKMYFDILIIDDAGDFHIFKECDEKTLNSYQGKAINTFTFGPALVIDGKVQTGFLDMNNSALKGARRIALAQTGPLEYLCVASDGPEDTRSSTNKKNKGLTMEEFAQLVGSFEGVQNAYNMDGGSSATMVFVCENKYGKMEWGKLNYYTNTRHVKDVIYFASAYQGKK